MKKVIIIFFIISSFCIGVMIPFPQKEENAKIESKIEQEEKICLEGLTATNDIVNCIQIATKQWETEIDNSLLKLKKTLTKEQYMLIEKNQNLWLKQAQSDKEIIDEFIAKSSGLMGVQFQYSDYEEIVKNRAQFLNWIYFLQSNKEEED